ncbi:MDR family MFS transporter [Pseudonocardia sp. GCM10023141]|uniref:MDR family MFS transporter n=1 Tax=Pseudonocardia sp. GCM10023141 TaxID=3252653 RepID=UPI00360A12A6
MTAPAAVGATPVTGDEHPGAMLSHRQILTIFAGLMIGMFLAALDQTIVATAIRTIADDLDGLSLQAWATTAYLITATISTPLYGKLSDLFGRKPLFLFAISIFVVGSVACTFATSMYELAAFRGVQGLGAGGLFSLALTIIGDIVAPRERAKYQGYFVAVFGTSSVLGPVAGGFFAGQAQLLGVTGWRWVFLINVPLGIIALIVVSRVLNVPHTKRKARIDWPGAVALCVALVPLLIVAEQGRDWGWDSPRALTCYAVGAVGVLAFILLERRIGDDALLPLRFFRVGVFSWGSIAGFIVGMGMFGALALLPLYLQIVKGATPTEAGLQTLPLVLGIMSMSVLSGQVISRTGRYKIWPIIGVILMIVGIGGLSFINADTPYWQTALLMVVIGWGLGGNMQPLTLAVQNAMPPRDMGVATASATFFRQMGGTLGTAIFLSVLFSSLGSKVAENFRSAAATPAFRAAISDPAVQANPANAPILGAVRGGAAPSFDDSSFLAHADAVLARPILDAFSGSMAIVFISAAAVLVVGLFAVFMMREVPLRTQSGVEAIRDADDQLAAAALAAPVVPAEALTAPVAIVHLPPVAEPDAGPTAELATVTGPESGATPDGPGVEDTGPMEALVTMPLPIVAPLAPGEGGSNGNGSGRPAADPGRLLVAERPEPRNVEPGNAEPRNAVAGRHEAAGPVVEPVAPPTADARDRLLASLLQDPGHAVTVVAAAEQARDSARRARTELQQRTAELHRATGELMAQGMTPAQVTALLGLEEADGAIGDR